MPIYDLFSIMYDYRYNFLEIYHYKVYKIAAVVVSNLITDIKCYILVIFHYCKNLMII